VRRAKDGDKLALAALCDRHSPRVHKIAQHVLRDPEDARDAAQESLVKLVQRVGQYRGQAQFSTWLHRLVVNTCKDLAQERFARRTELLLEDTREARDGDPVRALTAAETRRELGSRLAELPAAQAQVVGLKDAFDLPFDGRPVDDLFPAAIAFHLLALGIQGSIYNPLFHDLRDAIRTDLSSLRPSAPEPAVVG